MQRPLLFFPGFANPPAYYASLAEALTARLGAVVDVYCPPGVAERRDESWNGDFDSLIADITHRHKGPYAALIGHSWGCHLARSLARNTAPTSLVEIDPRLRARKTPHAKFDVPARLADRSELVSIYAREGRGEQDIRWDWWETQADGSLSLRLDPAQMTRYLQFEWPSYPATIWPQLQAVGIVVMRTARQSLSMADEFAAFKRDFPALRWQELAEIAHALDQAEQVKVAGKIADFLEPRGPSASG